MTAYWSTLTWSSSVVPRHRHLNRKARAVDPRGKDAQNPCKAACRCETVWPTTDLKARIPGLAVSGNGDVDLRILSLDYRSAFPSAITRDARPRMPG
jgi:AsmA protein